MSNILKSIKNTFQRQKYTKLLLFIVEATVNSEFHCANVPEVDAKKLLEAEPTFIQIKTAADPAGNVTVVALQPAIDAVKGVAAAEAPKPNGEAQKLEFKIETGIELPPTKRGFSKKPDVYPFAQMAAPEVKDGKQIYASFFVPNTAEKPNMAKSLASTVSSATKRYKGETPARKFIVRAVDGGARVFRVQ